MTRSAGPQRTHVRVRLQSVMTAAIRADPNAIDALITKLGNQRLDPHNRDFVREGRRLVLACGAGLDAVLSVHRPGEDPYGHEMCLGCGTRDCRTLGRIADVFAAYAVRPPPLDQAEAWRRADTHLGRASRTVPLSIEEFEDGYIARPMSLARDGQGTVLVIDRSTGKLSRWPDLPRDELIESYRRYLRGLL